MSMSVKLGELEKAVSQAIEQISSLRKAKPSAPSGKDENLKKLEEENRRLRAERQEFRKRVRRVIRSIDKVQW